MGQIELNCLLMLNWIVWNKTVVFFLHWNCVLMLSWIVWNRTVRMYKMDLALIIYNGWYAIKPNQIKSSRFMNLQQIVMIHLNAVSFSGINEPFRLYFDWTLQICEKNMINNIMGACLWVRISPRMHSYPLNSPMLEWI